MVSHGSLFFPATVPNVPTCTNNTSSTIHTGNCTTTQNPPLAVTPIPSFLPLNSSGSFFPFPTPSTDFQLFLSRPFDLSISRRRLPSPSHNPHLDLDLSSLTIFDRCPFTRNSSDSSPVITLSSTPPPTPVATSSVTQISRLGYIARGRPWSFTVRSDLRF